MQPFIRRNKYTPKTELYIPGLRPIKMLSGHSFVDLLVAKESIVDAEREHIFVSSFIIVYAVRSPRPSLFKSLFLAKAM